MLIACQACGTPSPERWCPQHREAGEALARARKAAMRRPGRSSKRDPQAAVRAAVLRRDRFTCRWCRAPATECDHIVPVDAGGHDVASNLVAACRTCNASRGASAGPPRRTGSGLPAAASVDPCAPPLPPLRPAAAPHRGVGSLGPLPPPPGSSPPPSTKNDAVGPFFSGPCDRGRPGGRR